MTQPYQRSSFVGKLGYSHPFDLSGARVSMDESPNLKGLSHKLSLLNDVAFRQ